MRENKLVALVPQLRERHARGPGGQNNIGDQLVEAAAELAVAAERARHKLVSASKAVARAR